MGLVPGDPPAPGDGDPEGDGRRLIGHLVDHQAVVVTQHPIEALHPPAGVLDRGGGVQQQVIEVDRSGCPQPFLIPAVSHRGQKMEIVV